MFLNFYLTKDYENVPLRRRGENKPNQTRSEEWGLMGWVVGFG